MCRNMNLELDPPPIVDAIRKAINIETGAGVDERCALAAMIWPHIRAFLSQKFTRAMIESDDEKLQRELERLWRDVTA